MLEVLIAVVAGAGAGILGSVLGLGGGIFLVPILHRALALPFLTAAAVSLFSVIGTSTAVSMLTASRQLLNLRLAVVLLVASVTGAMASARALAAGVISTGTSERVFGATALFIAVVMLQRLDRRNVIQDPDAPIGILGGRFHEQESGGVVSYRVRRVPLALAAAGVGGVISTLVGVGGGILIVPALNSWCGVPLRAAAATSAFMIGVTAVPGVVEHYALGHLTNLELVAAAVLGVLAGTRGGVWLSGRVPVKSLKILMASLLALVGVEYLFIGNW
jgi:uncharacterized membrane protein YfcA